MKIINFFPYCINKLWVVPLFCVYVVFMSYTYLYYKNLNPAFHSYMTKDRPFLINTEGYKLPDFDPFDESVLKYLLPSPNIDCSDGKRPLTSGVSNYRVSNSSATEVKSALIIHEQHLVDYNVESFDCCFQAIKRNTNSPKYEEHWDSPKYDYPDAKFYMEKKCHPILKKLTFVIEEGILVKCNHNSHMFYRNIHLFIPIEQPTSKFKQSDKKTKPDHLNVMILGIDSISRLNMQRYMPKSFAYLKEIALDLKGFNKNFENTYPNLVAVTTGYDYSKVEIQNVIKAAGGFQDNLPFVWKEFSAKGYTTFYGEDCSSLGTFAYKNKKGFRTPPTDYYLRPYMKAVEEILGSNEGYIWISGCKICGASKLMLQQVLDYAETVSLLFGEAQPYFSFLWTSSLTHDRLHFAGVADEPVLKFLKNMHENNLWNNTIVFFMSDHGVRFGGIRETYLGKKEESLPMSFIILPNWFKNKFSVAYENLVYNQDKLTTTMDLHETLVDIVNKKYIDENYLKQTHNVIEQKISLFRKISNSRSCFSAKIPLNYCAGQVAVEVPETFLVQLAAKSIISTLNLGLKKYPMCHQFSDFIVKKSYILQFYDRDVKPNSTFYEVKVLSFPGKALLEGIVEIYYNNQTYKPRVIEEISRINRYANQSYCINDNKYVKYCICK